MDYTVVPNKIIYSIYWNFLVTIPNTKVALVIGQGEVTVLERDSWMGLS